MAEHNLTSKQKIYVDVLYGITGLDPNNLVGVEHDLVEAARAGNIDALYASIRSDPNILDRIDGIPFVDTPLHVAASAGHTCFAMEIIIMKPSFGRKLNPYGLSPLVLALHKGHFETMKRLIKFDSELIRVKGREGFTPLHRVAETENVNLLAELLCACPASIEDLTVRDETALHIAVKNFRLEAFEVLLQWLRKTRNGPVLKWTDEKGDTVLHIAVSTKQPQIVSLLLEKARMIKNEKNLEGLTALDIASKLGHDEASLQVRNILLRANALEASSLRNNDGSFADFLISPLKVDEVILRFILNSRRNLSTEMSNMLLVVAVLIATATFQAVFRPPGAFSLGVDNNSHPNPIPSSYVGKVGKAYFAGFYLVNTVAFNASIALITLILLQLRSFSNFLVHFSLFFLVTGYGIALIILSRLGLIDASLMLVACLFPFVAYIFGLYIWVRELFLMSEELETYTDLDYIIRLPRKCLQMVTDSEYAQRFWTRVRRGRTISWTGRLRMLSLLEKLSK